MDVWIWIRYLVRICKKTYPDVPTLLVCYQKGEKNGEKSKGWDDHPIYLPMLVLPRQKFVFMFNYDEDEDN